MVDILDEKIIKDFSITHRYRTKRNVEWFQTTVPENINHYLKHRGIDADSVISITVDGGIYRVFYKKTRLKEVSSEQPKIETRR